MNDTKKIINHPGCCTNRSNYSKLIQCFYFKDLYVFYYDDSGESKLNSERNSVFSSSFTALKDDT